MATPPQPPPDRPPSPGADPAAYGIGQRVRRLRLGRSMGLVELGRHTGLSASLLSKIETGKAIPTLQTLHRIAMVFSVGLDHFFTAEHSRPVFAVVRASERLRFPGQPGSTRPSYWFESLDFPAVNRRLDAYLADVEPAAEPGEVTHEHDGVEFVFVTEGSLGLWHDGAETRLDAGDSVYFDSSRAHGYRRLGEAPCRAVVVSVPPAER